MIPSYLSLTMLLGLAPAMEISTPVPISAAPPEIVVEVRVMRVAEELVPYLLRVATDPKTNRATLVRTFIDDVKDWAPLNKDGPTFLNDKQLQLFKECAQGDRGTVITALPRVVTLSGAPASIEVGYMHPASKENKQPRFFGTQLNVTPTANEDLSRVLVDLSFEVTEDPNCRHDGDRASAVTERMKVSSKASIPDGRTLVLMGGKTETRDERYYTPPILEDIPYLNRIFRSSIIVHSRKQTLLLVCPRIVKNEMGESKNVASACGMGITINCAKNLSMVPACCKGSTLTLAACAEAAATPACCTNELPALKRIATDALGTPGMVCDVKLPKKLHPSLYPHHDRMIMVKDSGISAYSTATQLFSWLDWTTPTPEHEQATSQVRTESPVKCCSTAVPVASNCGRLNVADVETLYAAGVSDAVIINQIRTTGSTFNLSTDDLIRLSRLRIHEPIIQAMQNARMPMMPESIQVIGGQMGGQTGGYR